MTRSALWALAAVALRSTPAYGNHDPYRLDRLNRFDQSDPPDPGSAGANRAQAIARLYAASALGQIEQAGGQLRFEEGSVEFELSIVDKDARTLPRWTSRGRASRSSRSA